MPGSVSKRCVSKNKTHFFAPRLLHSRTTMPTPHHRTSFCTLLALAVGLLAVNIFPSPCLVSAASPTPLYQSVGRGKGRRSTRSSTAKTAPNSNSNSNSPPLFAPNRYQGPGAAVWGEVNALLCDAMSLLVPNAKLVSPASVSGGAGFGNRKAMESEEALRKVAEILESKDLSIKDSPDREFFMVSIIVE